MGNLDAFIAKWEASGAAERANKDAFLIELCDVLGVDRPAPTTGDGDKDAYVFERDAKFSHEGGVVTVGKIDLYKAGAFILEAKQGSEAGAKKIGTAKRGTAAWNIAMNDAYGQALGYARSFDTPVPFLVVCDIGHCFDLYAAFDESWDYRPFPNAQAQRIYLRDLTNEKHVESLRKVFTDPHALDPSKHAAKVTTDVAEHIAVLAKRLEGKHAPETVATFLMRCLFTMFAEDVGLLPENAFTHAVRDLWLPNPSSFTGGIESLWRAMNDGGHLFGVAGKILKFNGGLFAEPSALPLDAEGLADLLEAAKCSWTDVEPAIFGTLLERALDPKERHRLGAHYTPRAYVERLVRPTIEEPLRADWDLVQAQVRRLVAAGYEATTEKETAKKTKEAVALVREFHKKLATTRVLDPACGTGNFLYVTLDLFKRLEGEVLATLSGLGEDQQLLHMEGFRVTPQQFLGIEVKRWAKEIAELVLWIGYLQWHFRLYGKNLPVPEPVLRDYKNIECRDAVLAYDAEELVRDEKTGKPLTRWDGETMKKSPVTGEAVPDETAQVPIYTYVNPRKAEWPEADFIVGNPPFLGNKRMNNVLGAEYVGALRGVWDEIPESVDLVMYWWAHAAALVQAGRSRRAGLITTSSVTQSFNRSLVADVLKQCHIAFAVPNHPWVDAGNGAAVRIAMTVVAPGAGTGTLMLVEQELDAKDGGDAVGRFSSRSGLIHADLRIGADIATVGPLQANRGVSFMGVTLSGQGFVVDADERAGIEAGALRAYLVGNELNRRPLNRLVIDFFGLDDDAARSSFPRAYQRVLERVRPERVLNKRPTYRDRWWIFAEPRGNMREATRGLQRYVAICRTAKHFVFQFVGGAVLVESKIVAVAIDDASVLGILSSRAHVRWAMARGSRHGVGNDLTYNNSLCFEAFPFPVCSDTLRERVAKLAEALDAHRKARQAEHADLTITGMYNVLEKLRSGEVLSAKEKVIHEQGLVSVLKKLHDDLDAAVFDAYGWPHDLTDEQILEKLVALNKERADEERRGIVRWLRPDFQNRSGKGTGAMTQVGFADKETEEDAPVVDAPSALAWPKKMAAQIEAVRDHVARSSDEIDAATLARTFKGAKAQDVEDVLESLAALGLLVYYELPEGKRWRAARFTKSASVPPPSA